MAFVATEVIKQGFVVVALPGTAVHATAEEIKKNGWEKKVKEVPDAGTASPDSAMATVTPDPNLPAGA